MKRIVTAAVGIPVVIAVTLYSPHWLFALVIAALAAVCFHELMTFGSPQDGLQPGPWSALAAAAVTASFIGNATCVVLMTVVAFLFCLVVMTAGGTTKTLLPRMSLVALGLLYCGVLLGFVVWLRAYDAVLMLLATIWAGDSAAYYAGRALGRHKLAPSISPNKTVEGSIAGLIASTITGAAFGMWLLPSLSYPALAALAAAIAGQVGDLVESAMKRSAGVKDSSALLPGHGGMLDRLDSLLFAAPVFYWFMHS